MKYFLCFLMHSLVCSQVETFEEIIFAVIPIGIATMGCNMAPITMVKEPTDFLDTALIYKQHVYKEIGMKEYKIFPMTLKKVETIFFR